MRPVDLVCELCGRSDALRDGTRCACGAAAPTRILAAALLHHLGWRAASLAALPPATPPTAVLDATGDPALRRALAGGPFTVTAVAPDGWGQAPAGAFDVVLTRGVLGAARSPAAALRALAQRIGPGGMLVLQDRFPWPLPPMSDPPLADGDDGPDTGDRAAPRTLGGDIVDAIGRAGLSALAFRPYISLDPLYREIVFLGTNEATA